MHGNMNVKSSGIFFDFYSWDETAAKCEAPKSEGWLYSVLLVC